MNVLVTGGAGYIGSHTSLVLIEAGYSVYIVDNFSNSKPEAIIRLRELAAGDFSFERCELCDFNAVKKLFAENQFDAVIHFAGLKAVGESVEKPLAYYENNIVSTINLLKCMKMHNAVRFVFSSSATVYGDPATVPISEDFPLNATNPYGRTKLFIENILKDYSVAEPQMRIALLRYFNPAGAHPSGRIGEDPNDIPNNLMPYIAQVAAGKLKQLFIYGNDYPTHDGTGVRDYIHVCDLARGHVDALKKLDDGAGVYTYNLGTGRGYSVLEMVRAFEAASGRRIDYRFTERRKGDIAECYANPQKAFEQLGWEAKHGVERMCQNSWRWQQNNPNGYSV